MDRAKRLTLVTAILGTFVVGIDSTVVNVALPAISRDLGGGLAGQQWVTNAYLLFLGSLILIGGSLGDIFGERRVFRIGVAGFGIVSAACAVAPGIETLIAARALQGAFGALLSPAALAIIIGTFPPSERGAAIGSWTAWSGIATVIGPLVGGQLVDSASWRWIFAINVPFVLVTLALSARVPAGEPGRSHARVDGVGAALAALGLAGPTFALIEQPRLGWSDPGVWAPLVGGIVLVAAFLAWERRHRDPMLPLGLFRSRTFAVGNIETLTMYAGLGVLFFFLVIFLQQVAGYTALQSGLAVLPITVVMFTLSKRFGALADRLGARPFMALGPLVAAAGLLLFLRVGAPLDYATELLPAILVFGVGLSLTVAPLTATVLGGADEHNAGIASAVNNAVARVAGLLATAALGAIVAAQFAGGLDANLAGRRLDAGGRSAVAAAKGRSLGVADTRGLPPAEARRLAVASRDASTHTFHIAVGIAAALVALGGMLGGVGIRDPGRAPRRRRVRAAQCAGGQFVAAPVEASQDGARAPVPARVPG